ncbi:MAG: zinc ABC transporter substrate-binding protein [Limosilactobacillus sp.]|uniref:metal ABC transporter solute-binding protein, Zn/Mn family n=1 Tax=Limosilactobacillus sp. TaxID=2773925 RepID=UPI00271002AB|nr:zinc ABC transporter substrate-binding protein [Limosilactobacillus sp.]
MKKFWMGISALVGLLIVIFLLALVPLRSFGTHEKPIRVVTSLNFYGEAAKQVAGKYGQVTSIIDNDSVDPHEYTPSTKDGRNISNANLVIANGLGYDHWLNKLAKSNGAKSVTTITVGTDIAHKKDGDNEHIWYQPDTMKKLTNKLADQYAKMDPDHASYYRSRAKAYLKSLQKLDQQIATVKQNVQADQSVAVSEPVFDYALANLGYKVSDSHFAKAIEDGNDPSPKDVSELQDAIKGHKIAFFVENSQTDDKVVTNLVKLAKKNNVPVLKVTESKPNDKTYSQWMMSQYQALAKIQKGE